MNCQRCGCQFEPPSSTPTELVLVPPNICGTCADDLRDQEEAEFASNEEDAERLARDSY